MGFEFIYEKEGKEVSLDEVSGKNLAKSIALDFKTYNDARQENITKAERLIDEIFFRNKVVEEEKDKTKKWKTKVKICKTFMFYQTLKAFIWKNIYANSNSMFDVSGENQNADNASNKQKAMLVNVFEKMEYPKIADIIIDNSLFYGELVSYTAWKKKEEEYRRPITFFETLFKTDIQKLPLILQAKAKGKNYYIDTRVTYNNPYIYDINPANFVFDVAQMDEWDSCPKIYRTFKTPNDIINNRLYNITDELKTELEAIIKAPDETTQANQSDKNKKEETVNGNTVEVLEHWGDLRLKDGTVLKNWHAVVIKGQHLVRFAKNEFITNPFTFGAYLIDPKTKRGLSPLISILDLALFQEDLMNRTCDMQKLNENAPVFAPKGFFDEEEINLYPGKIIEFGDQLNPAEIKPMTFNSDIFLKDIMLFNDLLSEICGIFPNMTGQDESSNKTATEISTKVQGQMTRLSMLLDTINQYLIVPDVKNVASLLANFKSGKEQIFINKDNKREIIEVDDNVRQGEYKYTYADRNSTAERFNKADMTATAIKEFAQVIPLNMKEFFTWYMEQKGVENPERFLLEMPQAPVPPNPPVGADGQMVNGDTVPQVVSEDGSIPQTPIVG